jgi:molybdopterin-guanine dinucleotide biosynthesis protein A
MGNDKAFLELAGKPLIVRALELAHEVVTDVCIVGDTTKFAPYGPVVEDVYLNRGPLGGIHAALSQSQRECNLMLAVDLPFVPAEFLKYLLGRAESSAATVTVPSLNGFFQPLCAVYRKQFLAAAEPRLAENRNKIDQLFRDIPLCTVSEADLVEHGFDGSIFRNLNTPEEWQQATKDFAENSPGSFKPPPRI